VDDLGRRIVSGAVEAGVFLPPEAGLSASLEVSRTVVREAIKVLAEKGLVESRPKLGTRVLPRDHWRLSDADVLGWQFETDDGRLQEQVSEVRALIEPRAASLAATRRTDEEAVRLRKLMDRLAAAVDDPEEYVAADLALHASILDATHNQLLAELTSTLSVALRAGRTTSTQVPSGVATAMDAHRQVVDAIVERDPESAFRAMSEVVISAAQDVREVLCRDRRS
jgi:GntR family transcriptional regulator, galactonate operon transcriptional repressor